MWGKKQRTGSDPLLGSRADRAGLRGQLTCSRHVDPTHFQGQGLAEADQSEYPAYAQPCEEEPHSGSDGAGDTHSKGSHESVGLGPGAQAAHGKGVMVIADPQTQAQGQHLPCVLPRAKGPRKSGGDSPWKREKDCPVRRG